MTRHISEEGLELIKRFEGFEPKVYLDAVGLPTIGYGHLLKKGEEKNFKGVTLTEQQASLLLRQDIREAELAVLRLIRVPLTDGQFAALVSFVFNLGAGALQRSSLRQKVNREEHGAVPHEFTKWVYAGGKKLKGLILRREAEARLYIKRIP